MASTPNVMELFANIRQARQQISKLKNEAQVMEADPFNTGNQNMKEYMKNVSYSLSKNDQTIEKKCNEYKSKLPSIHRQQKNEVDLSFVNSYKKYKKNFEHPKKKKISDQSTKIDNSFSFSIQNRPAKIHSTHERSIKPEVADPLDSHIQIPSEFIKLKEEAARLELMTITRKQKSLSHIARGISSQKNKRIKYVDLNKSSSIREDVLQAPSAVEYKEIVDKYSKHEFMIIHGKIADDGPQYASYNRIYESIFPKIRSEIKKLEAILTEKHINFARFDGKKLAYLCLKDEVKKTQLIDCLIDENGKLKQFLLPATKYMGKQGKIRAVVRIQAYYKMHVTRSKYQLLKSKTIILQSFFRTNLRKLELEKKIHERNSKILDKFESRQDKLINNWKEIKKTKRIEIHLNSIEVEEEKRLSIENFMERENIQLSRIFRLKDQNLIIIYVSTSELSPELINYYYRMLDLAGVPKYQDRLLFFSPSNAKHFPEHFSVSKLLYYSSKTLKQLKIITEDLPTLLIPGYPSNQLIKICDFLKCYLLSGSPQNVKPFTTRSQTLRFFKNLSLDVLPSAMEMYDYGEFLNTFSVLIMKHPEVKVWILKIDDEFGGRGIAYCDVGKSKAIQHLLDKVYYGQNQQFFATNAIDVAAEPQNQEITIKLRDFLKENLPEKLKVATPTVYRSYEQFMGRFIKKGGVIEAKPPVSNKSTLSYPSISFFVEPSGEYQIVTSYEKIMGSACRSYACSFPQKALDMKIPNTIIRKICESFKLRKIFGFFTLDFICGENSQDEKNVWVIDMDPFINNETSSYFLFDILMGGTFFPEKSIYLVQKQDEKSETVSIDTMASQAHQSYHNLVERTYVFIPHLFNPNLFRLKIREFFKQARIQKFNFDVGNKEGLCIMLLDQLTSGTMSMIAVSPAKFQAITLLKRVVEFIVRLSAVKNVDYGRTDSEPSTDRILIKDVLSLFISLVRKDERTDAKKKAVRQHEFKKDLQYIN